MRAGRPKNTIKSSGCISLQPELFVPQNDTSQCLRARLSAMFILRAFARRAGLGLAPGEHAPAVILPVQAVPGGQLGAALEAVFLFELQTRGAK